jgi:hypothetical protein
MGRVSTEASTMKKHHDLSDLKFEDGFLVIAVDGETKRFQLKKISPLLEKASDEERNNFEISPSGYGIHWPLLDEDISIDGLLGIVHAPQWKKKIA